MQDSNGQVGGGGVSVYYSHSLKLLLFSYSSGKSFAASISRDMDKLPMLFQLTFKRWEYQNKTTVKFVMRGHSKSVPLWQVSPHCRYISMLKVQFGLQKMQYRYTKKCPLITGLLYLAFDTINITLAGNQIYVSCFEDIYSINYDQHLHICIQVCSLVTFTTV